MSALRDFLSRNSTPVAEALPLTHTTYAYHVRKFMSTNKIITSPCSVFAGESLSYFFVGRPSYKPVTSNQSEFWELPVTFVVDFTSVPLPHRVYPFDSGGHVSKRTPGYISMMPLDEFEVADVPQSPQKIIGAFFGNARNYFSFKGRSEKGFIRDNELSPLDAEIHALHKLSIMQPGKKFDDRQFSIEIQADHDVGLSPKFVKAVICPIIYMDDDKFVSHVEKIWGAQILTYDLYPLNSEYYTYGIYDRLKTFLDENGYLG